jgi:outer membrane protein assembly factor BamB
LRRTIRNRERLESFENRDPDRLRLVASSERGAEEPAPNAPRRLRYAERWRAEIDGLDASGIFPSGDRLIVATPKLTLALSRRDGTVLWSQPTARASSLLCGNTLVRALPDGELEMSDLTDGSVLARMHFVTRGPGALSGLFAGGGSLPPMAVLVEGRDRIVAIDLRTGQSRWDFRVRGAGQFQLRRAGRVLLVASGDASLHALDVATGEVAWRFSDRVRFCLAPAVVGDVAVAAAGEPGGGGGAAYGIDLYSGHVAWTRQLPCAPSAEPVAAGSVVVLAHGRSRAARVTGVDARDGRRLWTMADPGLDQGGTLSTDEGSLFVNAPSGRASCFEANSGQARWTRTLANPLTDDVPRQLDPVLHQGVLFVPSAQLHVLRPADGETVTTIDCDLVPDFLYVDEQHHVLVAEESGHVRAYAPLPELRLVK